MKLSNIGRGLFGGFFDGKPGAFSQHEGGIRGLLASFVDGQEGNGLDAPSSELDNALVGLGLGVGTQSQATQKPKANGWRTFQDVLFDGMSPAQSKERQLAAQSAAEQRAQMLDMAQRVIKDPRELMVFLNNPEEWTKQNAERYGSDVLSQGSVLTHGGQAVNAAPVVEKFDDRFGVYDPLSGEHGYTDPRGPTFSERTDWMPEGFRPEIGEDGQATGNASLDPGYRNFALSKAAAGATRVNVPITLPAQNSFAQEFAKLYAGDLSDARDQADAAQRAMGVLERINGTVDKANTGMFAAPMQAKDRALAALGRDDNAERAAATEQLESDLNSLVLPLVKQLGSSNSITNADREFIAKIVGTKDLTPQAIKRITEIQRRDAQAKIARFNQMGGEAFSAVPPAQGLPQGAFRRDQAQQQRKRYNPQTGAFE